MKINRGVILELNVFFTQVLGRGELSELTFRPLFLRVNYSSTHWIGGWNCHRTGLDIWRREKSLFRA